MTAKRKPGAGFFSMPPAERKAAIDRIIVAASGPPDDENLLAADIEQADIDFDLHFDVKTARADNWRKLLKRIRKSLESNARLIELRSDPQKTRRSL